MKAIGRKQDGLRWLSSYAHRQGNRRVKYCASAMKVTARSVQRWRNEEYAVGSPGYRYLEAIQCSDDPWPLAVAAIVEAIRRAFDGVPTPELITQYHELRAEDVRQEGESNALTMNPTATWSEQAEAELLDASLDLQLLALRVEFDERRVALRDVL